MLSMANTRKLWKSPIYRFRFPKNEGSATLTELVFDVTGSAPSFNEVKGTMKTAFDDLLRLYGKNIGTVMDFGAAKFRNTLYFLKKGKTTSAVEFEEIPEKSEQAKKLLDLCKKQSKFDKFIFPYPFISSTKKYDLVLLVNVLPVMPIFSERLLVLQLLYDKIKLGKYLLWYAQKEGSYKDIREEGKQLFGDGIWMGVEKRFKTFFKYHQIHEIEEMMNLCGFERIKKFVAPGNDVILYQKTKHNLFSEVITAKKILSEIKLDESIEDPKTKQGKKVKKQRNTEIVIPDPDSLSIETLYAEALLKIPINEKNAEKYHRLSSQILNRVFRNSLGNMEIKLTMYNGRKIPDTVFTNIAEKGFFKKLENTCKCNYIIVEAKNINKDPANEEFDQLSGRLNDHIGKFGILVCRNIKDKKIVKQRCESYLDKPEYLIALTDDDLIDLLDLRRENDDSGINDFMDQKLRPLIFRSK